MPSSTAVGLSQKHEDDDDENDDADNADEADDDHDADDDDGDCDHNPDDILSSSLSVIKKQFCTLAMFLFNNV